MAPDRVSPLSFVCANIIASVIKDCPSAVPLYYFCGIHAASSDGLEGPQRLMQCLITKLLLELQSRYPVEATSLNFVTAGLSVDTLYRCDMGDLCSLFRYGVAQFPPQTTIYCVIDGIIFYEKPEMLHDALLLVHHLIDLVESPQAEGPVIKVLLATPCPSRQIASPLLMHRRIFLQAGLVLDDALTGRIGFANFRPPAQRLEGLVAVGVGNRDAPLESEEPWTADDYI